MRKGKTMSDYISREAVTNELEKHKYSRDYCVLHNIDWAIDFGMAMASVDSIPSADVRPNIHGHWMKDDALSITIDIYRCSNCSSMSGAIHYNFCPHCGADMREPIGEKGE